MKRIACILFALLLMLSLAACASTPSTDLKVPNNVSSGETGEETQKDDLSGDTGGESQNSNLPGSTEATIAETVLLDEKGVKITAKSLDADALFGPEIKLLIENNSGEDLTFQARNSSINGYMVETMMSVDVVSGKKANDALSFSASSLEACGIETIADMEFSFHIFTTEGWDDYLDSAQIQLKTSAAEGYQYSFDDSGDVAYEGNGIKIVVKGLSEDDSIFGPGIVVYIENTSDKNITVQTRDVSINGFMIDGIFSSDVMAGKHAVDSITFMDSDLEENDITEITEVELSFHIFTMENWDTITDTDVITITF